MALGDNIRRLRRDRGWTLGQLSEHTGIKIAHLSRLEHDDADPKTSTLYKLMQALGVSPDTLLMDTDRLPPDPLLKQSLERVQTLTDAQKRHLVHMIDMYCIAAGMLQQTDEDRPLARIFLDPHKPLIDAAEAPVPETSDSSSTTR